MLIWGNGCCAEGWFGHGQVTLPWPRAVTRTPWDAEPCHYLLLFQSYMPLLVCQQADCICGERTERERGQREGLQYLILKINPAKHEKHSGGETDRAVPAAQPLMWPLRLFYKLTMHDSLYITHYFLRGFYALAEWVGSSDAIISHTNARNPGETAKKRENRI